MMTVDEVDRGELVPVREACRLLNVHGNTLRRWSNQGLVTAYRIGTRRDRRFRREDLYAVLRSHGVNQ